MRLLLWSLVDSWAWWNLPKDFYHARNLDRISDQVALLERRIRELPRNSRRRQYWERKWEELVMLYYAYEDAYHLRAVPKKSSKPPK